MLAAAKEACVRTPERTRPGLDAERDFLRGYDASAYERPSVAVDIVLLTAHEGELRALLLRRTEHPEKGKWSLPGGFVRVTESLDAAAERVLAEKAGLRAVFVEQLYTFGAVGRDPRTRVISVVYYALVDAERLLSQPFTGEDDRRMARVVVPWEGEAGGAVQAAGESGPLALAFDHAEMLGMAVKRIRGKLDYAPIGFQLLPSTFTLRELQTVHETILGRSLNKDAFRRRILASGQLAPTGEREQEVGHRPAELYRFTRASAV